MHFLHIFSVVRMRKYIFFEVNPFDFQTSFIGMEAAKPVSPECRFSFPCVVLINVIVINNSHLLSDYYTPSTMLTVYACISFELPDNPMRYVLVPPFL